MLDFQESKVTAVLIAGTSWAAIQKGTFHIDRLALGDEALEAEGYGFTYKEPQGPTHITGRLSALLAVKTDTPGPQQQPA